MSESSFLVGSHLFDMIPPNVILNLKFPCLQDAKICFSNDTLPDGYSVNKGDMVAYQPYAMGRMKFIWGDDIEEFRPGRWLNEEGIFQLESPFKFTAFQVSVGTYCISTFSCFRL